MSVAVTTADQRIRRLLTDTGVHAQGERRNLRHGCDAGIRQRGIDDRAIDVRVLPPQIRQRETPSAGRVLDGAGGVERAVDSPLAGHDPLGESMGARRHPWARSDTSLRPVSSA